ncbi:hypothetical protein FXB38_05930 [Bradyrhizobium cytisi]|uniref:Uncharacterized protein n=1 Tax=Bradyrhizobium cytisi TaxID=515489 RepID=A0A5S4WXU2_9BRAD|nr:hypothetical protein FXB38_05930 [Bradyrhizobium cytisi]
MIPAGKEHQRRKVDDADAMQEATIQHLGIAILPDWNAAVAPAHRIPHRPRRRLTPSLSSLNDAHEKTRISLLRTLDALAAIADPLGWRHAAAIDRACGGG